MTKFAFWCQFRELERKYDQKLDSSVRRRLQRIDDWASTLMDGWAATEEIPLWLKNELKYLDVELNFLREVALKIQLFRIAEDEYNGADEDEAWWKPGRNCETEPPSQRLTQRAPFDQGWPIEAVSEEF